MTNQPLEVKNSVLVIPRRLNIARHLSVQVLPFMLLIIFQQSFFFWKFLNFNITAAIAAEWQDWGQWSQCSVSCGKGSKLRARACSGALFGGDDQCSGESSEAGECKISECKGIPSAHYSCTEENLAAVNAEWQEWGQWSECTASCGHGSTFRARACSGALFGGDEQCSGESTEAGECKISECPGILFNWGQ